MVDAKFPTTDWKALQGISDTLGTREEREKSIPTPMSVGFFAKDPQDDRSFDSGGCGHVYKGFAKLDESGIIHVSPQRLSSGCVAEDVDGCFALACRDQRAQNGFPEPEGMSSMPLL